MEIYKADDGHIYTLDLTSTGTLLPQQLSREVAATMDDTCTLLGAFSSTDRAGFFEATEAISMQDPMPRDL